MTGVEVNLEDDKAQIIALNEEVTVGPYKTLSETEDFLQVQACVRINKEMFFKITTSITYKDGKIITQKSETEDLNDDPSEGQDWNWEDYEWSTLGLEIIRGENDQSRCIWQGCAAYI